MPHGRLTPEHLLLLSSDHGIAIMMIAGERVECFYFKTPFETLGSHNFLPIGPGRLALFEKGADSLFGVVRRHQVGEVVLFELR